MPSGTERDERRGPRLVAAYAPGAGLGHLTRVVGAHRSLAPDARLVLLTDSRFALDRRVVADAEVRVAPAPGADPQGGHGSGPALPPDLDAEVAARAVDRWHWLRRELVVLAPDEVWIDAFPAGLWGEVDAGVLPWPTPRTRHLARLLRWDRYRPCIGALPVTYDEVCWAEAPADDGQVAHLAAHSRSQRSLSVTWPPAAAVGPTGRPAAPPEDADWWLVAHAGDDAEVAELVAYATDLRAVEPPAGSVAAGSAAGPARHRLVVSHPGPLPRSAVAAWPGPVQVVDAVPLAGLAEAADVVVTAAGWASVTQLQSLRAAAPRRHRILPLPRRFDDQFTRATRARR